MKRFKINFAVIALILGITFAFATKTTPTVHNGRQTTTWFYNGTGSSLPDLQDGSNWDTTNSGSCVTSGTRPCSITVAADNQEDLGTYLSGFTKPQILAMSSQRKP